MVRFVREQANKCRGAAKSRRTVVELDAPDCKIVELRFWKGRASSLKPPWADTTLGPARRRYLTAEGY